jgi:hypothetical protein
MREIFRILKPGGRVALSDIALKKPLPAELAGDIGAYVSCIAGAVLIAEYRQYLATAGFSNIAVIDSGADLNGYAKADGQSGCCSSVINETGDGDDTKKGASSLNIVASGCCGTSAPKKKLHADIADVLRRYNINEYAAGVKVLAVKNC